VEEISTITSDPLGGWACRLQKWCIFVFLVAVLIECRSAEEALFVNPLAPLNITRIWRPIVLVSHVLSVLRLRSERTKLLLLLHGKLLESFVAVKQAAGEVAFGKDKLAGLPWGKPVDKLILAEAMESLEMLAEMVFPGE
jgi:hypothetical protein